jgi:peptide/nickel transport system ATP-binding protein
MLIKIDRAYQPTEEKKGMLNIRNLSVWFDSTGVTHAVRNVSMMLADGEKMVIIGETGSGKSVFLQAILRLLPPTAHCTGEVILNNIDLLQIPWSDMCNVRGAKLGYIPQGAGHAMNPLLSIGYQVGESWMIHNHRKRREAKKKAITLLRRFQLGEEETIVHTYPHMLSGGMRQRAMVAMGTAAGAAVILADEPTKGLDEKRIQMVIDSFKQLDRQTLLCVTHDISFAKAIQVEVADSKRFFSQPLHPYSRALLASQPDNGFNCLIGFAPPKAASLIDTCVFAQLCPQAHKRCEHEPPMFDVEGRQVRCWLYEN